jgi:hypothetical protein
MADIPSQIRLAPGDYFMHGQDRRMRSLGLAGNVCAAVHRVGPGFDVERVRQRVASSPVFDWLARVHITRPMAVLPAVWRAEPGPQPIFFEHQSPSFNGSGPLALPAAVYSRELHAGRGPAITFDLIQHPDGTYHFVFSWNHALLDARGVDLVMNHLLSENDADSQSVIQNLISPKQQARARLKTWWRNVNLAHGAIKWLDESGREPLFSLLPKGPPSPQARNRYRVLSFTREQNARIDARCQQLLVGFRRSHFHLAASLRAVHQLAVRRGNKEAAYLVPVPHDTRRRGSKGPIFSNHLSILFYRIEFGQAGKLSDILAELGKQMTAQIRDRFPECCMAALDMFKPLPLDWYVSRLGKPTRQKFASFCFSDSGEACAGITKLFGGDLLEVTHLVPSWRPPGMTIVFLSFNGGVTALISWVDDCISDAEVDALEKDLRYALFDEPIP